MKKDIRTEIEINAPAEKVWQILSDFEKFPTWNPFVIKVLGTPKTDEVLEIQVQLPESMLLKFKPRVLVAEPNKELRWVGKMPLGMFRGEHFYQIESLSKDKSKFIHGEHFSGWTIGFTWMILGKAIEKGYQLMNEALKKEAEK